MSVHSGIFPLKSLFQSDIKPWCLNDIPDIQDNAQQNLDDNCPHGQNQKKVD
jgi:hypothetical protein